MLKMSSKIAGACALSSVLVGCTWYSQLEHPSANREARIGQYKAEPQDSYLQRFDELQQRIEALERENHRLRSPKGARRGMAQRHNNANSAIAPHKTSEPKADLQNEVIEEVKLKVSQAVLAIDNVLSQLNLLGSVEVDKQEADTQQAYTQESELVASLASPENTVNIADEGGNSVSGSLARNADGDVVRSTVDLPNSKTRFNYSVVYSYPEITPWNSMWSVLEDADITDKWRGVNRRKPTYFIYVGAYVNERDAENRQQNLLTVTGEEPFLRKRAINRAIAAN